MTTFRALEAAETAIWAMEPAALETLLTIAAREHDVTPEALEAYQAKSLERAEQATVRDGVAIISASGPLFKRANLFTALSGATSYDIMRRDLQAAVDGKLKGAILNLDSPGGEASGTAELAAYVASLRGSFPVIAYVNGMGASAAYWLASAAQEIVVDSTAILGSIGVQMALRSRDDPKGTTTHTFISSQSPMKNADPASEAGAKHIQGVVDAMAQVFVESVASNRGVDVKTVLSNFGKGGLFVGQDAVKAGLADRIGNFEGVLAELAAPGRDRGKAKGATMSDAATDAAVATARADGAAAERKRVSGLRTVALGLAVSDADLSAAIDGDMTVEAFSLAQATKARPGARLGGDVEPQRGRALAALKAMDGPAAKEPKAYTVEAIAARIAAA
jgi:ClpP class serine protease